MQTRLYLSDDKASWNAFVHSSRNATFLFDRNFMEYHKDRFQDASLIFVNEKGKWQGIFPANFNAAEKRIDSHGGLTYGGLLMNKGTSLDEVRDMFRCLGQFYTDMGAESLRYKPLPYIYQSYPSQEDLYWLFRSQAELTARSVSTTIDLKDALPFSTLRKRKVKKAIGQQLQVCRGQKEDWAAYWQILTDVLEHQHGTRPVHTLSEIQFLADQFPDHIHLFVVKNGERVIAGCVIFVCNETIHIQYIASSDEGRGCGALDYLFHTLIQKYAEAGKHYFDFGISTEEGGTYLNEGLLFQKEGFGGRAICYDVYDVQLKHLIKL